MLCSSLDILLQLNNINTPSIQDVKSRENELFDIFSKIIVENQFIEIGDDDEANEYNKRQIIKHFIRIIVTIIVYKNKKKINDILTMYQFYTHTFKNNLLIGFKNKLNVVYNDFKDFMSNKVIDKHFIAINIYIHNFINNIPQNVIWV